MNLIDQAVQYIIRPNRDLYHINRLGPPRFNIRNSYGKLIQYLRQDFQIQTLRNNQPHTIQASFYRPTLSSYPNDNCIIYLHTNNGSRVEPLLYISTLLSSQSQNLFTICTFDSIGSGSSSGAYVTLGVDEASDLDEVIKQVSREKLVKNIVLWGRSMGACSALMFSSKYLKKIERYGVEIRGMILDSPFSDLKKVIKELATQRINAPEIFFSPLLFFIERKLKQKINKDFNDYQMEQYLNNSRCVPALFLVSKNDQLVRATHTENIYEKYIHPHKEIFYIGVEHHENRDKQVIHKCVEFINKSFSGIMQETINKKNDIKIVTQEPINTPLFTCNSKQLFPSNQQNSYLICPLSSCHKSQSNEDSNNSISLHKKPTNNIFSFKDRSVGRRQIYGRPTTLHNIYQMEDRRHGSPQYFQKLNLKNIQRLEENGSHKAQSSLKQQNGLVWEGNIFNHQSNSYINNVKTNKASKTSLKPHFSLVD